LISKVLIEEESFIGHFEFFGQDTAEDIILLKKIIKNNFHIHELGTVNDQVHQVNKNDLEINSLVELGLDNLLLGLREQGRLF
jgi:hypothetical protein